jgi:hypothetical protein
VKFLLTREELVVMYNVLREKAKRQILPDAEYDLLDKLKAWLGM